jgi:hypothetical protein
MGGSGERSVWLEFPRNHCSPASLGRVSAKLGGVRKRKRQPSPPPARACREPYGIVTVIAL